VYQLPSKLGRGAALRTGIEKARGNIIAFFPADAEYSAASLPAMVSPVVHTDAKAVFGTRVVKFVDLPAHLRQIYQNNRRLYLTSKYGGMALSILTLLLYNRYVTDVLTSVKVFDAHLLKTLDLEGQGIDLDTEIIAKLSLRREYILELPVEFKARTRAQGKKITPADGVKAMLALFKHRIRTA
jgi:glycosyltransferase involved in cell wall biosynthesis